MAIPEAQLTDWFTYHAPNREQQDRYQRIRSEALALAKTFVACSQAGPDQTAALRKLREAVMTINAAVALEAPTPTPNPAP